MQTVYVGLSGGVDSAVSAALLKREGYRVVGAFIKIWRPEFSECPWREDRLDAMRVAATLEIPFREIDLSEEYKNEVVDDMLKSYAQGITPNPDILCNRHIKFGSFAKWALEDGADMIATGHYAHTDGMRLFRGHEHKDQSYFLYTLTREDLAHTLFPVGRMPKSEVRELAASFNLPVARKRDSQGLCFVGDVTMPEFLSKVIPVTAGPVLNSEGKEIGEHRGAALYTIGERHGFTLHNSSSNMTPHYVIHIDTAENSITVSDTRSDAYRTEVTLTKTTWVHEAASGAVLVQTRYRGDIVPGTVSTEEGTKVTFETPQLAPPGQSLVIYKDNEVLGGGIIM